MILVQVLVSGILLGGLYALISLGLTIVFGVVRIVNFAHGACVMLAMYATFWLAKGSGLDPYVLAPFVTIIFAFVGVGLYHGIFRFTIGRSHAVQIFASVGLLVLLENLALVLWGADFRTLRTAASDVLRVGGIRLPIGLVVAFVVSIAVAVVLLLVTTRTRFGKNMQAVTQDRYAAMLVGVNPQRIFGWSFAIGIGLAGLAGALLSPLYSIYPQVGVQYGLVAFVVVVLGGMGSLYGAVAGGLIVGVVEALAGYYLSSAYQELSYFAIFILVLLLRPQGLFGREGSAEIGQEVV